MISENQQDTPSNLRDWLNSDANKKSYGSFPLPIVRVFPPVHARNNTPYLKKKLTVLVKWPGQMGKKTTPNQVDLAS